MKCRCFLAVAALLGAVLSCSKEIDDPMRPAPGNEPEQSVKLVPLTIEVGGGTRAAIDGSKILWEADDRIAVFDGSGIREFTRNVFALQDEPRPLPAVAHQVDECLEDILFGDDADDFIVCIDNRKDGDAGFQHFTCCFLEEDIW